MSVRQTAGHGNSLALLAAVVRAPNSAIDLLLSARVRKSHPVPFYPFNSKAHHNIALNTNGQLRAFSSAVRGSYRSEAAASSTDVDTESLRASQLAKAVISPRRKLASRFRETGTSEDAGSFFGSLRPSPPTQRGPPPPDPDIQVPLSTSTLRKSFKNPYAAPYYNISDSNNASTVLSANESPSLHRDYIPQPSSIQTKSLLAHPIKDWRASRSGKPPLHPTKTRPPANPRSSRHQNRSETPTVLDVVPSRTKSLPWQQQKAALSEKFPEGWNPRKKLSPDALDGIRSLHEHDPVKFTTPFLASHFKVPHDAIRRILKSKWRPTEQEAADRRRRWESRGERVWETMREMGLREKTWEQKTQEKERNERREIKKAIEKALEDGPKESRKDDSHSMTGEGEMSAPLANKARGEGMFDSLRENTGSYTSQTGEKEKNDGFWEHTKSEAGEKQQKVKRKIKTKPRTKRRLES